MASDQPTPGILRFLLPSVRDLIFIFVFWSLLAGPLANRPLSDADIGWHVRTGEQILATHAIPRSDPFSSTMQGQPWFAWEWLYDAVLGTLHRACGLNGVVWLCALLVAAFFALMLSQLLRRGTGLPLALALMLLAEAAAAIHMYARPHIASWLFSLLWFAGLESWEGRGGKDVRRWLWWFFPVSMALWVNVHGGWLFGLGLLGVYTVAAWGETWRAKDALSAIAAAHRAKAMGQAWMASAAATLVNPFGWRLHAHIYGYLGDRYLINRIDEFRSPDFHGWAERSFVVILLLLLVAWSGQRRRVRLSHLLAALLAASAGFYSSRNLPVAAMMIVLIAGPTLWENFMAVGDRPQAWRWLRGMVARIADFSERMGAQEMELRGHVWPIAAVGLAWAISLQGGWLGSRQVIHARFDAQRMPVGAVNFLLREGGSAGPVFSTDSWGGYLIYRMYPERKVVVDDRHDLYGRERIRQYLVLTLVEPGWQRVLQDWQIRTAVLPARSTLANLLRTLPQDWRVVYEDKVAVVVERR